MSTNKRPWYKWYPRDFNQDEKVKGLGWDAELIYRRILDVMWQSNNCQLPNDIDYLHKAVAIAIPKKRFATAWLQIQRENFSLFSEKNGFIYSKRLKIELKELIKLSNIRKKLGKKGGVAKAIAIGKQKLKQMGSDTDTDTDTDIEIKDNPKGKDGKIAVPLKNIISNGSIPKVKAEIQKVGKELYDKRIFPEVFAFINKIKKEQKSERAILHSLTRCYAKSVNKGGFKKDGGPWAYCTRIIQIENGNFNEAEHLKTQA